MKAKDNSQAPLENNESVVPMATLQEHVKQALLAILADPGASAAAKASAGRTLLDYFGDNDTASVSGKRTSELTLAELDAELAGR